ncbi:DUF4476 domain-containing protein [Mucilaginibacter pedocola]|uniref:DUF4476 domain-containing protein n=1 Tax=Mucilaginibacter pedocola TaxID=1792845 RepID=A0A1S9PI57_9SPHI|nr:DUF4476 domain-containing protein [Mucilaginibacter pedocola]OOQ60645.1 hypothetical protein BC343_23910 [Mucilaginibacter pedocola]
MKKVLYTALLLALSFGAKLSAEQVRHRFEVPVHQKIQHPKQAMPDEQAHAILAAMQQKGSDGDKVLVLTAGVKDKGITTKQLTPLLKQFAADPGKLVSAKFAYPYTVDYKQYDKLKDLFADEDSKRELESYVSKHDR